MGKPSRRTWTLAAVAAVVATVCLVVLKSTIVGTSEQSVGMSVGIPGRSSNQAGSLADQLGGLEHVERAEVPLALVADFYDHETEHVPPRQGGGVMQARERFYTAPGNPFELLHARLGSSGSDGLLAQQLADLEQHWLAGKPFDDRQLAELEQSAIISSLTAEALLEAGRGLDFLAGDRAAAALFRAALARAQQQHGATQPGDPAALDLLHLLDQTRALGRLHDIPALGRRFGLAMRLYPSMSIEARRAACLYADAQLNAGKADEAANVIVTVFAQDRQIGDLGLVERSDLAEMNWRAGRCLSAAKRYDEAAKYLSEFVQSDDPRRTTGLWLLIACLQHAGRDGEAEAVQSHYQLVRQQPQSRPSGTPSMQ